MSSTGRFTSRLILVGILGFGAAARAQELAAIAVQAGHFSTLRGADQVEIGWEVRFAPRELRLLGRTLPWTPAAGAMVTGDGAQYVYAGGRFDVPLGGFWSWLLTPSCSLGLYNREDGKNLGGVLEFRSAVEISRRLGRYGRLGATFYHLSNAGLYRPNPGSESLVLTYSAGLR